MNLDDLRGLSAGQRVLALYGKEELVRCNFTSGEHAFFTYFNLGILTAPPREIPYGIELPMERHLEKCYQGDFINTPNVNLLGWYAHNLENHKGQDLVGQFYREWENKDGPITIRMVGNLRILADEEADERFWHKGFFKTGSGLDLSYVFALKRLGSKIPEEIRKQYLQDLERHGGELKRYLEGKKEEIEIAQRRVAQISEIFLE